jgi:hypothetical protein
MLAFAVTTVIIGVVVVRRRQYRDVRLVILDVTVVSPVALAQAGFTDFNDRFDS